MFDLFPNDEVFLSLNMSLDKHAKIYVHFPLKIVFFIYDVGNRFVMCKCCRIDEIDNKIFSFLFLDMHVQRFRFPEAIGTCY